MKALGSSAVIGLRDVLTGEARATRVRRLATPSWLSTRAMMTEIGLVDIVSEPLIPGITRLVSAVRPNE